MHRDLAQASPLASLDWLLALGYDAQDPNVDQPLSKIRVS